MLVSVAFLGERLVTGCEDGSLELLDPAERQSIVRLPDHDPGYGKQVNALAVHGASVAAGSENGRVMLWNLDPQWWMRRACRRAGTDAKPCRSLGGPPAELSGPPAENPSGTPPPDSRATPDDRPPPSGAARTTPAVRRRGGGEDDFLEEVERHVAGAGEGHHQCRPARQLRMAKRLTSL